MLKFNCKKVQYIFFIIISFFSAIYLMCIINEETLTTNLQRIFIVFYFWLLLFFVLIIIKEKCGLLNDLTQRKGTFFLSMLFSLVVTIILWKFNMPYEYLDTSVTVNILNENNIDSKGKEAWLAEIKIDGSSVSIDEVIENSELRWKKNGNIVYANGEENPGILMLHVPKKKEMELQFTKHAWSGKIQVNFNGKEEIYDLYDAKGSSLSIVIPINVREYSGWFKLIILIGIFCSCFILLYSIFTLIVWKRGRITVHFILLLVCLLCTFAVYKYVKTPNIESVIIQPMGECNPVSNGSEVWITSIEDSNSVYDLEKIELPVDWFTKDKMLVNTGENATALVVPVDKRESITMSFIMHPWSGKIYVQRGKLKEELDLYSLNGDNKIITLDGNQTSNILIIVFLSILWIIEGCIFIKENKIRINHKWKYIITFVCMYCILNSSKLINISFEIKIFLAIITFLSVIILYNNLNGILIKKYFSFKIYLLHWLSAIYAAFATFGYDLFLSGEYIATTFLSLIVFVCAIIWYYILILSLLYCLEWVQCNTYKEKMSKTEYKKIRTLIFLVLFIIWEVVLFNYRPGNLSSDSTDQWLQAMGIRRMEPTHSMLLTLIIRALISIIPSPMFVLTIQILIGAAVFSQIIVLFHQSVRKIWITCLITFLVAIIPSNYMLMTTLWKDIPFSLSMLVLTYLLYNACKLPGDFWTKKKNVIYLVIVLIGVKEFRQNGMLIFAFSIILLVYWMVKYKMLIKHILLTLIITIGSIVLIHGPVFTLLNVNNTSTKPFITMFAALGSAVNKGKTFSEDTTEILYRIMKQEDWIEYYSPFNIDSYRHNPKIIGGMDVNKASFNEAFSCYFEGLEKYPTIIIKDRLDGSNIIWDVTQPEKSFNFRYSKGIWMPSGFKTNILGIQNGDSQSYQPDHLLTELFDKIASLVQKNEIMDMLVFRSGIYLVFYFVLLVFSVVHRKKQFYAASIPILGNVVALMLLCAHQSYRYVWNIPLCVMTLLVLLLSDDIEKKKEVEP